MGYFRYTYTVKHEGLGKYRVISGTDNALAKAKATALLQTLEGKPLTLMNGANLLYLLEKHGHKAKIDIAEAKKTLGEKPF